MNLQIRKFDITNTKKHCIILIIGAGSDKRQLVRDIMYHKRDISTGTVIVPREDDKDFYSEYINATCIHSEYDTSIIKHVLTQQKEMAKLLQHEKIHLKIPTINPAAFLILDNSENEEINDEIMKYAYMNNRHFYLSIILSQENVPEITSLIRVNIDYVFIFQDSNIVNMRNIYKQFAGIFSSFEDFYAVMNQCTKENFECLVIDNTINSKNLEDKILWYKAESHAAFQVCNPLQYI